MSAQIVNLAEHRRVRELANALADMANGRADDLIVLQHLMTDDPDFAQALVRRLFAGRLTLPQAASIARRWFRP